MSETSAPEMVTLTVDGVTVTVQKGTKVIEAARQAGKLIPHFCYHPGLPVDGNCRMCIADIRSWNARTNQHIPARRPAVSCCTEVEPNMLVLTETPEVLHSRKSVMEFLLINHPIDCPICDKAGECMLQDHYMRHDRQRSELRDDKVHKPRLVPFGERIVYNAERCILCSRCTRFTAEVSKTHDLGIVNRGDRAIVELTESSDFDHPYTDNVADVCPVGALTKTDFRFKKRVWFLKHTDSVCGGCSRNCNTVLDHDRHEIVRIMPRQRDDINKWWMCNEGRDLYKRLESMQRPASTGGALAAAQASLTERLVAAKKQPKRAAIIASSWMTNEEGYLLAHLASKALKTPHLALKADIVTGLPSDAVLHTDDHNPNQRGLRDVGVAPGKDGLDLQGILGACDRGEIDVLLVVGPGLAHSFESGEEGLRAVLAKVGTVLQITAEADAVTSLAHAVVPTRTWAERDGTWTNVDGKTSIFRKALEAPEDSCDDFEFLQKLCAALGSKAPADNVRDARKKIKLDPSLQAREVADGDFEFYVNQALYRHAGGVLEV